MRRKRCLRMFAKKVGSWKDIRGCVHKLGEISSYYDLFQEFLIKITSIDSKYFKIMMFLIFKVVDKNENKKPNKKKKNCNFSFSNCLFS